jgi:CRISPR-associated protein Cas1
LNQKLINQTKHLERLKVNRDGEKAKILYDAIIKIEYMRQNILNIDNLPIASVRNTIEGFEGIAGRCYFGVLADVIPEQYAFSGRNKNPSEDMFNCMLNYAYAILYSNVEKACILSSGN